MGKSAILSALLLFVATLLPVPAAAAAPGEGAVVAKYYAWFDQSTWASGKPSDLPAQPYLSSDRGAIERQVDQARAAGIDGFVLNWWGPDNPTDTNLQTLLEESVFDFSSSFHLRDSIDLRFQVNNLSDERLRMYRDGQPDRIGRYDLYGRRYLLDVTFRF